MVAEGGLRSAAVPFLESCDIFSRAECSSRPGYDEASSLLVLVGLFECRVEFFTHFLVKSV